jgi:hypothetical protein
MYSYKWSHIREGCFVGGFEGQASLSEELKDSFANLLPRSVDSGFAMARS